LTGKIEASSKIAVNASNKVKLLEETVRKLSSIVGNLKKKEWCDQGPDIYLEVDVEHKIESTNIKSILKQHMSPNLHPRLLNHKFSNLQN